MIKSAKPHTDKVNDMQKSADEMMIITASKDNFSKLLDTESMQVLKVYKTDRPVNSASISPIRDQVKLYLHLKIFLSDLFKFSTHDMSEVLN